MNSYTFKGMDLKLGILDVNKKVDITSKLQSTEKFVLKIKNLIKTYYILQSFVGCNHSFGSGELLTCFTPTLKKKTNSVTNHWLVRAPVSN